VRVTVCPHCAVSFPLRHGVSPREVTCPRCGKPLQADLAPSPLVLSGVIFLVLGILIALGAAEGGVVILGIGGAVAAGGLGLLGVARLLR
jgi:uncharacterized paraquat-inducible protein A